MSHSQLLATGHPADGVVIRCLGDADLNAVRRLAQLDSAPPLQGRLLGAEIEGRLLAVISLDTGESAGDPFARTAELRALLELRAAQLRRRSEGGRRHRRGRGVRATAALAGSPPGAPGWLMAQRPRTY